MSLGFPGVPNPSPVLSANVLWGSVVTFPESFWKDAEAIPGICAIPPRSPSSHPHRGLSPSQHPHFGLGRGWGVSATQFMQGTPPEGVVATAWTLPTAQSHLRVQTSLCGRNSILDVLKTAGWNSLKAEPETESCQTWGKLGLIRASLLRPFSSQVPKKSQPCLCHSHSLWSRKCSFRWSPWLTIFGTLFIPVGSGAGLGEQEWGASE